MRLTGRVPQVCVLFGPGGGRGYIPAFCDVVIMREGNASMYLGSPRMAEMVIGEKVTLEEMGGAKMHTGVTGAATSCEDRRGGRSTSPGAYLSYFPSNWHESRPLAPPAEPGADAPVSAI